MTKLINRVKRLRFELQLKQHELAKLMDCDQSLIAKIETGAAPLSSKLAAKLAEITREHLTTK
jgi:transcriptional regulator with XRE-family HTH domain